jgi:hypothetical protein
MPNSQNAHEDGSSSETMAALPTILVALDEAGESAENVPRLFMLL